MYLMNVYIGSDHSGFKLKTCILNEFKGVVLKQNHKDIVNYINLVDVCCLYGETCDYPDSVVEVCDMVKEDKGSIGILITDTGIGMSIVANKINGISCALCHNEYMAEMSKKHNNSNILALGERIINKEMAFKILLTFINNEFEGNIHIQKLNKIIGIENNYIY